MISVVLATVVLVIAMALSAVLVAAWLGACMSQGFEKVRPEVEESIARGRAERAANDQFYESMKAISQAALDELKGIRADFAAMQRSDRAL